MGKHHNSTTSRLLGNFSVNKNTRLSGLLTIPERERTTLYLWDDNNIINHDEINTTISGRLHNNRTVTLIQCRSERPGVRYGTEYGTTSTVTVVPRFVVYGPDTFIVRNRNIRRVTFRTDDMNILFNDRIAFSYDRLPFYDASVTARYSGKSEIFHATTIIGNVLARRKVNSQPIFDMSDGVSISTTAYVVIEFPELIDLTQCIRRLFLLRDFFSIVVGRPQNVLETKMGVSVDGADDREYELDSRLFRRYEKGTPDRTDLIWGRLLDASSDDQGFSRILTNWLLRGSDWNEARDRFHDCIARGSTYDRDRLIAAANLFDLLPSSVFDEKPSVPQPILVAVQEFRAIVQRLRKSHGEQREMLDGVLGGLGRINRLTLKQKVRARARCILERLDTQFPELERVINKAVDGRNRYVHGTPSRLMESGNEANLVVFFTQSLEFIFGVADLVDAGWDVVGWYNRNPHGSHPFAEYAISYSRIVALFLQALESGRADPR